MIFTLTIATTFHFAISIHHQPAQCFQIASVLNSLFLITLPIISRLHFKLLKNTYNLHNLSSILHLQTLLTTCCHNPYIAANLSYLEFPQDTLISHDSRLYYMLIPFPGVAFLTDMFQLILQDPLQIQSSLRRFLQCPQAVNIAVIFDF